MKISNLLLNRYTDRFVFSHVRPDLHAAYKLVRSGVYDSERVQMSHRAVKWLLLNNVRGSVCEFGTAGGESFLNLYFQFSKLQTPCPHFFLFDSFEGLPVSDAKTAHEGWKAGDFSYPYEAFLRRMDFFGIPRGAYSATKGFFDQTLSHDSALRLRLGRVALVHIDCDYYESTDLALRFIEADLQDGTVILFDDYYCSRGNPHLGESGAFQAWLSRHAEWQGVPWCDYSIHGKAFILSRRA
jgi:hypothetical protein